MFQKIRHTFPFFIIHWVTNWPLVLLITSKSINHTNACLLREVEPGSWFIFWVFSIVLAKKWHSVRKMATAIFLLLLCFVSYWAAWTWFGFPPLSSGSLLIWSWFCRGRFVYVFSSYFALTFWSYISWWSWNRCWKSSGGWSWTWWPEMIQRFVTFVPFSTMLEGWWGSMGGEVLWVVGFYVNHVNHVPLSLIWNLLAYNLKITFPCYSLRLIIRSQWSWPWFLWHGALRSSV